MAVMPFPVLATSPLDTALIVYESKGLDHFLPMLIKNSPLEKDPSVLKNKEVIRNIEKYYGKILGHEILDVCTVSSRVEIVNYVIHYEQGPLYGTVSLYDSTSGTIVTWLNFQTDISKAFEAVSRVECRQAEDL